MHIYIYIYIEIHRNLCKLCSSAYNSKSITNVNIYFCNEISVIILKTVEYQKVVRYTKFVYIHRMYCTCIQ